jgi:hypothetical protein
MVPRNLDPAKLLQMRRQPLRVKQYKFAGAQVFHERDERNLRPFRDVMEH